jgi:tetratricopeptide (TPR) repeat protein
MASRGTKNRSRDGDIRRERIARQEAAIPIAKPRAGNTAIVTAVCCLLALAVALVFAQTAGHDFVNFDDAEYVQDNPHVAGGVTIEGIAWSFTHFYMANWHPLTWLSHMVDCQLYGVKRADGHHLTAVLLHAANTILLFLVLRSMTGDLWPAAFVAALFGIHPLHVESVAWVAERKDVLSTLFFMLSLAAYVGYARRPFSIFRYLLVTLLFALGLMAKAMLVTLPLVFLLLDYWPLARRERAKGNHRPLKLVLIEKIPLLAISGVSCVVTYYAQAATESVWEHLPLSTRVANALTSYVGYLRQFVYPAGLAAFYPHPQEAMLVWQIAGSLLVLGGITLVCLAARRNWPFLLVGWLWFLGMLVPVVGLVQVGAQAMADRYSYLPQIGLYIAIAWGVEGLLRDRARTSARSGWHVPELAKGVVSALVLAALTFVAWRQAAYWKNGVTLWSRALDCTSSNSLAHNSLGRALAERGKIPEAVHQFRKALAIDPDDDFAHSNLGIALARSSKVEDIDEALGHLQNVLTMKPQDELTQKNLGALLIRRGRLDEAIEHLETALRLDPNDQVAATNLAAARAARQKSANPQLPPSRLNQQ